MSEIKALKKLREWSRWLDCTYATDDGESYTVYSYRPYDGMKSCGEYIRDACDEIQAEVDSRFMELPVDLDGVPIRPGDQMTNNTKRADGLGIAKWDVVSVNHLAFFDMSKGSHLGCQYVHGKPRTLEDVLEEFAYKVCDLNVEKREVAKYAAEIRELLA